MNSCVAAAPSWSTSWRCTAAGTRAAKRQRAPIDRIMAMLRQWRRRAQARRELAGLDDYLLHDIGLSRSQAQFESGKPFWRA